jgi:protein-S-isoprenylcysteine O-methyltransferase Ste14
MERLDLLLAGSLYVPVAIAAALWLHRPPRAGERAGIFFAFTWCAVSLLAVHAAALRFDWWRFDATGPGLFGFPVELQIGWAILWGVLPALAFPRPPLTAIVAAMVALDLALMPQLAPALQLGPTWLLGEAMAVGLCLIPAQLLYRSTRDDTHLPARAVMLCASFTTLMFGVLPAVILARTGGSWQQLLSRPAWFASLALQLLAIPAALGVSAVQEFVLRGGGTPVPFDATKRLVTSGPYAYVSNPMQLANSLILLGLGAVLGSWWVAAAGAMSVVYSAGLAAWDERRDLGARFGEPWLAYRRVVRAWIPRWRPYATPGRRAVLYVSANCSKCREVARWFSWRRAVSLEIVPAEWHPSRDLDRITYDPGDGSREEHGVAAVARALEHINFAWALCGMIMRLPGVCFAIQAFVDASGGGPQRVARCELADPAVLAP